MIFVYEKVPPTIKTNKKVELKKKVKKYKVYAERKNSSNHLRLIINDRDISFNLIPDTGLSLVDTDNILKNLC